MSDKSKIIDIDAVRLARLSRLDISEKDAVAVSAQLKKMADYTYPRLTSEGSALPFSNSTPSPLADLREDRIGESSPYKTANDSLISLFPTEKDRYITVPRVISVQKEDEQ